RELFRDKILFDREKMHVVTGRGCPYSCSYCCHSFYNRLYNDQAVKIRKRSVRGVIEEIVRFKKEFPLKFVVFDDDIFILPYNWLEEFCAEYKKHVDLPFFCYLRADLVDERTVQNLKSAGCFSVSMGIETAEENLRNRIFKRNMSREQIVSAAKLIKAYKIKLKASNIIAAPGSPLDVDLGTLELNILCKTDYSSVELLTPYPETEICSWFDADVDKKHPESCQKNKYAKRQAQNLRNLFAIIVEFPALFNLVRVLIKLPCAKFYEFCFFIWEGYCAYFRLYPAGWLSFGRGIKKYACRAKESFLKKELFTRI
ncbi:MAG: radical SAM protein, partial [Candidatus Omnitrophica bacterium]|nr:radical SAM protein [Candidatus Omnitrophota bacterium]